MITHRILSLSVRDFFRDNGVIYAAALSYFVIVAMVPLCLFMLGIFGTVLGQSAEFHRFLLMRLMNLFPTITTGIAGELSSLITFGGLAKSSLLLYALLSYQLYAGLHKSMKAVFKVEASRTLLGMLLLPLMLTTLVMLLLFTSFAMSTSLKVYNVLSTIEALDKFLPEIIVGRVLSFSIEYAVPLLIMALTVILLYMVVPKKRIYFDDAFWGGIFTAIMIETAKHLFTWYVGSVSRLGTIYGSLSAFVTFLIWVFFCSCIFMLGAEIVHHLDMKRQQTGRTFNVLTALKKRG